MHERQQRRGGGSGAAGDRQTQKGSQQQQKQQQQVGLGRRQRPDSPGGSSSDDGEGGEALALPKKRVRVVAPVDKLVDAAVARPARWGPPLAAMLRQHGAAALTGPVEGFAAAAASGSTAAAAAAAWGPGSGDGGGSGCCYALLLLRGVASRLPGLLAAASVATAATQVAGGGSGSSSIGATATTAGGTVAAGSGALALARGWDDLLWLLRVTRELALVWPAQLHPAAASRPLPPCADDAARRALLAQQAQAAEAAGLWQAVWDAAVSHAEASASPVPPAAGAQQAQAAAASCFGFGPAVREASTWLLQAQLASRLLVGAGAGLARPALAARLQPLWAPPLGDASAALLATLAADGRLGARGRDVGEAVAALAAACIATLESGGPGGGSAVAVAPPPAPLPRPPVLAALHALLEAPPALGGPALHELRCEAAAGEAGGPQPASAVNGGMLAARLLAHQDAWEVGLLAPGLLQSPRLTAEAAAALAGGSATAVALAAARPGAAAGGDMTAAAIACAAAAAGSAAAAGGGGAPCDWWVPDPESSVAERQLAALEPADEQLARRLEAAQAVNLARGISGVDDGRSCGGEVDSGSPEAAAGAAAEEGEAPDTATAWWCAAAPAAQRLIAALGAMASRLSPPAGVGFQDGADAAAAAAAAAATAAATAEAARLHLLPLLQAATAALALCAAAAARPAPPPGLRVPPAGSPGDIGSNAQQQGGSAGPLSAGTSPATGEDPADLLGSRLADAAASALLRASPAFRALLPDGTALYAGSPLLRQLSLLAAELSRLVRLRRDVIGAIAPAVGDILRAMEAEALRAAQATSAAAAAAAQRYLQLQSSANFAPADPDFDDDLDLGTVASYKRPATTPAVLTTHPSTNAAAAAQATAAAAAAAAAAAGTGGLGAAHALAAAGAGLLSGKAYGGAPGVEGAALRVLRALAPVDGSAVAACVSRLWRQVQALTGAAPPDHLLIDMADTMAAAVCEDGWLHVRSALMMLDSEHGLLSHQGGKSSVPPAPTTFAVIALVGRLAAAAVACGMTDVLLESPTSLERRLRGATGGDGSGGDVEMDGGGAGAGDNEPILSHMVQVLDVALAKVEEMEMKEGEGLPAHDPSPLHARLQAGRTLTALLLLHPDLFGSQGELSHLAGRAKRLLTDKSHAVRSSAGQLLCALLAVSSDPQRFLAEELLPCLPLELPSALQPPAGAEGAWAAAARPASDDESALESYWETGLLQLVEAAMAAPTLEGRALLLLCGHAAAARRVLAEAEASGSVQPGWGDTVAPLVAAAAELLAARSRYEPGRAQCALYHAPYIAWEWRVNCGLDLRQLLSARAVLAAPQRPCDGGIGPDICSEVSDADFAHLFAPALLPALLLRTDMSALSSLSRLLAFPGPRELLAARYAEAVGPLMALGAQPQYLASVTAALKHPSILELLPMERQGELVSQELRCVATHMLCCAALVPGAPPGVRLPPTSTSRPPDSASEAAALIGAVPGSGGEPLTPLLLPQVVAARIKSCMTGVNLQRLESRVLRNPYLPSVLLSTQRHVLSAAAPAHRAARLGTAQALMLLLGPRMATTGTACYLCCLLLQLAPESEAQPAACALLGSLLHRVASIAFSEEQPEAARATALTLLGTLLQDVSGAAAAALEAKLRARHAAAWRLRAQGIGSADALASFAGDLPASDPVVALLCSVFSSLPLPPLLPWLRTLDPPPAIGALAPACAAHGYVRRGIVPQEEIAAFAARAGSMAPTSRRRALGALKASLAGREADLLLPPTAGPLPGPWEAVGEGAGCDAEARAGGRLVPRVAAAAWRLVRLGAQLDDPGVSAFAAQLLAMGGPLPPEVISCPLAASGGGFGDEGGGDAGDTVIYMSSAGDDDAAGPAASSLGGSATRRGSSRGHGGGAAGGDAAATAAAAAASPTGDPRRDAMLFGVLKLLGSNLAGPDPRAVATAQDAVRALLATEEGGAALQPLQDTLEAARAAAGPGDTAAAGRALIACYLATLRPRGESPGKDGNSGAAAASNADTGPAASPWDAPIWSPLSAATHEAWLCRLSAAALSACERDPVLRLLAPAAALLPAAAEALLPHALRELVGAGAGAFNESAPVGVPPSLAQQLLGEAFQSALSEGATSLEAAGAGDGAGGTPGGAAAAAPAGAATARAGSFGRGHGSFGRSASGASADGGSSFGHGNGGRHGAGGYSGVGDVRRALRVLLRCLEFLRGIHRDAMLSAKGRAPADRNHPYHWRTVFAVRVPYLTVARAAAACGARFAALVYIDLWCDRRYRRAALPRAAALAAAASQPTAAAGAAAALPAPTLLDRLLPGPTQAAAAGWPSQPAAVAVPTPAGRQKRTSRAAVVTAAKGASAAGAPDASTDGAGDGEASEEQALTDVEGLLLGLYATINEPDGVYAIAALMDSGRSRLALQRHEGRWGEVLAATDARLQHPQASLGDDGSGSSNGGAAAELELLRALEGMGCRHSAEWYVRGLAGAPAAAAGAAALPGALMSTHSSSRAAVRGGGREATELAEVCAELAWRLGDWDDAPSSAASGRAAATASAAGRGGSAAGVAAAVGGSGGGFQGTVLRSLQLLRAGDGEAFDAALSGARHAAVCGLANSGDESAVTVNRALVRLQMLELLRRAWSVKWASRDAPSGPTSPTTGLPSSARPTAELLSRLLGPMGHGVAPHRATGGAGVPDSATLLPRGEFALSNQLLALQACLTQILGRPDALAVTLEASAAIARRAGHLDAAEAAIGRVQRLVRDCAAASDGDTGGATTAAAAATQGSGGGIGSGSGARVGLEPGWWRRMVRPDAPWLLEAVKLTWDRSQTAAALRELHALIAAVEGATAAAEAAASTPRAGGPSPSPPPPETAAQHLARMLSLAGKWSAATQHGGGRTATVMDLMVRGAETLRDGGGGDGPLACRVFFRLASFADERYRQTQQQMSSPEFRTQQLVINTKRRQLAAWESRMRAPGLTENARRHCQASINGLARVIRADEAATTALRDLATRCLHIALQNYGRALQAGGDHDLAAVYRLCQLWLGLSDDAAVTQRVKEVVRTVPSAKFVPLVYQIASRMSARAMAGQAGDAQKAFQQVLHRALERMALDHPYHTLYSIIALRNGNLGRNGLPVASGAGQVARQEFDMDKVAAATDLLAQLARNPRRAALVGEMESMVSCFVELAATQFPAKNGPPPDGWPFPAAIKRRLQSLSLVPIPTMPLPIDPSGAYTDVPTLLELGSRLGHAGGINAPKVLQATDSRGRSHRMLVKSGNDDLRQDAVMQQFFGLVNTLLASTPDTSARQLGMGTYRVVPISPAAGLVQWVENTVPMADYLAGRNRQGGAHARYRVRGDWSWFDCYNKIHKTSDPDALLPAFLECLSRFPPVFRHFFLEAFRAPAAWFEARARYTRSIAVSSMAGYVIGLGDRHLGNMLLDRSSAGVLQIDLGVAFEQGMFLNTPEMVPFRLTRDVVDGMGAFGVEGPLRRCCEATMAVLRRHRDALLTVVEVVLHDPLYRWQMNPIKAQRRQQDPAAGPDDGSDADGGTDGTTGGASGAPSGSEAPVNADAARAVLRVKQKLEGAAGGEGEPLDVAAQVDVLLAEAQDPALLSRMFVGWSAWM